MVVDHDTAQRASIDRFSAQAGNLFVRDGANGFPGANEAVNVDQKPFLSQGFGPDGRVVSYYNFDVQPTAPAPIFVLFREGESAPVAGQHNIIDVIPGEQGYNDFWQVIRVTVPADYLANTMTSLAELNAAGFAMETTSTLVNCPVVPEGSTAGFRFGGADDGLVKGWYKQEAVFYFAFVEKAGGLAVTATGEVPLSSIYVSFNINPNQPNGGPPSGFKNEEGSDQTHNVVATLPEDAAYSPLWSVNPYDNADFNEVTDLASVQAANILANDVARVNCPVVD
ncbi:MAG: hypothetical protein V3U27_17195 [Candidatus Tectomicrobia bacterium]